MTLTWVGASLEYCLFSFLFPTIPNICRLLSMQCSQRLCLVGCMWLIDCVRLIVYVCDYLGYVCVVDWLCLWMICCVCGWVVVCFIYWSCVWLIDVWLIGFVCVVDWWCFATDRLWVWLIDFACDCEIVCAICVYGFFDCVCDYLCAWSIVCVPVDILCCWSIVCVVVCVVEWLCSCMLLNHCVCE